MVGLIVWMSLGALYVAGLFPAAVRVVRQDAARPFCHGEDGPNRRDSYSHRYRSWCRKFHHDGCRRSEVASARNLRALPLALLWPVLGLGAAMSAAILNRARREPAKVIDLQQRIADLEHELRIEERA